MAKKSIWKKIKNWLTGSNKSASSSSLTKGSGYSSTSSNKQSNADAIKSAYAEREQKKRTAEEEQKRAYQKAKEERDAKAEKRKEQTANALAYKQGGNSSQAKAVQKKVETASNARKKYSDTVESEAKRLGVSAGQLQKMGGTDKTRAQDIKSSYKAHPYLTAASEGALRGATMGLSDIVTKNTKGATKKALEKAEKNYTTGQEVAKGVGELAGSLVTFGGTAGASEKIGDTVINKFGGGSEKAIEKLANSNFIKIKKYATKLSEKAGQEITADTLAKSFYKELSTDLGMNLGVGNIQAIVDAAETDGDLGDKLGNYARTQGMNAIIGYPLNKWQAGRGAINTARKALTDEAVKNVSDKAKEIGYVASHPYSEITGITDDPTVSAISNLERDISKLEEAKAKLKEGDSKISMIDDQIAANKNLIEKYKAKSTSELDLTVPEQAQELTSRAEGGDQSAINKLTRNYTAEAEVSNKRTSPLTEAEQTRVDEIEDELYALSELWSSEHKHILTPFGKVKARRDELLQELRDILYKEPEKPSSIAQMVRDAREGVGNVENNGGRAVSPRVNGERINVETGEVIPRVQPTTSATADDIVRNLPTEREQADMDEYLARLNAKENRGSMQDVLEEYTRRYKKGDLPVGDAEAEATAKQTPPATKQDIDEMLEPKAKTEVPKNGNVVDAETAKIKDNRAYDAEIDARNDNNPEYRIGEANKTVYAATDDATQRRIHKEDTFDSDVDEGLFKILHRDETSKEAAEFFEGKSAKQVLDDVINIGNGGLRINWNPESATIARKNVEKVAQAMVIAGRKISTSADSVWADVYQAAQKLYVNYGNLFGGALNAYKDYATLTGRGAQTATERTICNLLDDNIVVRNLLGLKNGEKFTIDKLGQLATSLTEKAKTSVAKARAEKIAGMVERIEGLADLTDPDEIKTEMTKIVADVSDSMPMTVLDRVNEWRYLAMLGNVKTHLRNKLGNSLFRQVRKTSGDVASALEKAIKSDAWQKRLSEAGVDDIKIATGRNAKATAQAKITDVSQLDGLGKIAHDSCEANITDILGHSSKYENAEAGFSGEAKEAIKWLEEAITSKNGVVHSLAELNSGFLELADKKAISIRYREYLYNYLEKNGYKMGERLTKAEYKRNKSVLQMGEKLAREEALISTFREFSAAANSLNMLTASTTSAGATAFQRGIGFAVNSVFPFVKTPMNILKQSINYSPAGLAKGCYMVNKAIKQADPVSLNNAIQEMASGLTGTGILGLGFALGLAGGDDGPLDGILEFTTNAGDDANAKHEKAQGKTNYSVIVGGKVAFSLDWLTPVAATFFSGVEFAKQLKSTDFDVLELIKNTPIIASRLVEPTLETSMLSGIDNILKAIENNSYVDDGEQTHLLLQVATAMVQNYLSSMIPTLPGQVARTIAPNQKSTAGDNYWLNTMINKVPGLNLTLPADTDDWGNVKGSWFNYGGNKTAADYLVQGAANLFSPSNISIVDLDENDEALKELYEATGNENVFPQKLYSGTRKVGAGDNATVLELTPEERSIYNQARAKSGGTDAMQAALQSDMFASRYDGMSTMQKAKAIENDTSTAPTSTKAVMNWLRQQPEYQNASQEDKVSLLSGIFSTADSEKAKGNEKSGERAVIESRGESVTDYEVKNALSESKYASYEAYKKEGTLSADIANSFYKYAVKNGQVSKTDATEYFNEHPELTSAQQNALYEIFKYPNAKSYSASSSSSGSSSGSSSSSSSSSSSDKSKAPDMGKTRKGTYKSMGSAVKKNKSVKDVVELKSNYSSKLKPPTAKW